MSVLLGVGRRAGRWLCRRDLAGQGRWLCRRDLASLAKQGREEEKTHFGFEEVPYGEKDGKVYQVFHSVADSYDLMNDCMSLGVHRIWKDILVERLGPVAGMRLLDVAGGTGDVAFRVASRLARLPQPAGKESKITVCDINEAMLAVGRKRAERLGLAEPAVEWAVGDAQDLASVPDDSYTAYTIAFGLRNVTDVGAALREARRVLVPGGRFLCLEFSRVHNPLLSWLYDRYSFQVIPALGQVVAGDWKSYQYLVESIRRFPDQAELSAMMTEAGFAHVRHEDLTFGVVAIHSGFKL